MVAMNILKNEYLTNNPSSVKIQLNLVTEIAFWFSLFISNLGLSYLGFQRKAIFYGDCSVIDEMLAGFFSHKIWQKEDI